MASTSDGNARKISVMQHDDGVHPGVVIISRQKTQKRPHGNRDRQYHHCHFQGAAESENHAGEDVPPRHIRPEPKRGVRCHAGIGQIHIGAACSGNGATYGAKIAKIREITTMANPTMDNLLLRKLYQ